VPWQNYVGRPRRNPSHRADPGVTVIDTSGHATNLQIAYGSVGTDSSGNTPGHVVDPVQHDSFGWFSLDGHTAPASTLHLRATEYTVGVNGPAGHGRRPLPPTTGLYLRRNVYC